MSDQAVQPAAKPRRALRRLQRVINVFAAPSKTFADIKAGHKSWWLPFLITVLCGAFLYAAITLQVDLEDGLRKPAKARSPNLQNA